MVKVIDQNNGTQHDTKNTTRAYKQELNVSVKRLDENKERALSSLKDETQENEKYILNPNNKNQNTIDMSIKGTNIENKNGYVSANTGAVVDEGKPVNLSLNALPTNPSRISIAINQISKSAALYINQCGCGDLAVSLGNKV